MAEGIELAALFGMGGIVQPIEPGVIVRDAQSMATTKDQLVQPEDHLSFLSKKHRIAAATGPGTGTVPDTHLRTLELSTPRSWASLVW